MDKTTNHLHFECTYYSVEKVSDPIFIWKNLVDYNEARLHEATLNLHKHAWIFPACQQR